MQETWERMKILYKYIEVYFYIYIKGVFILHKYTIHLQAFVEIFIHIIWYNIYINNVYMLMYNMDFNTWYLIDIYTTLTIFIIRLKLNDKMEIWNIYMTRLTNFAIIKMVVGFGY